MTKFDNRLDVCLHDTAGCQTRLTTGWMFVLHNRLSNRFDNRLYRVNGVLGLQAQSYRNVVHMLASNAVTSSLKKLSPLLPESFSFVTADPSPALVNKRRLNKQQRNRFWSSTASFFC